MTSNTAKDTAREAFRNSGYRRVSIFSVDMLKESWAFHVQLMAFCFEQCSGSGLGVGVLQRKGSVNRRGAAINKAFAEEGLIFRVWWSFPYLSEIFEEEKMKKKSMWIQIVV